ncbi:hypothetical protein [Salirhabdus sp. Marseille-P4669]|nr:hypothetical protein [Salirhabdus sp. Marseille-P4669]
MSRKSKSKRFVSEGVKAVQKHDELFTYRERFSDAERKQKDMEQNSLGGI